MRSVFVGDKQIAEFRFLLRGKRMEERVVSVLTVFVNVFARGRLLRRLLPSLVSGGVRSLSAAAVPPQVWERLGARIPPFSARIRLKAQAAVRAERQAEEQAGA